MAGGERPPRPKHGPLAESRWDDAAGRWRVRLTAEGERAVAAFLADHPHPWRGPLNRMERLKKAVECRVVTLDAVRSAANEGVWRSAVAWAKGGTPSRAWFFGGVSYYLRKLYYDLGRAGKLRPPDASLDGHAASTTDRHPDYYEADRLAGAVLRLTGRQREAVSRYYGLGGHRPDPRGCQGVAEAMGLSRAAAEKLVERGVRALRTLMGNPK